MKPADVIRTAMNVAVRLELEVRALQAAEHEAIVAAVREKAALPANYWHVRYHVEMRAKAAQALALALTEAFAEGSDGDG